MATKPTKTPIYQIASKDTVNSAVAGLPHDDLETNIDDILTYLNGTNFAERDVAETISALWNFTVRPTVNGNAVWDAGNLTPANYALKSSLAAVATSGLYSDLTGTPSLAPVATSGAYTDLTGKPTLATVATSGLYSDLTGTPSLKAVATSGLYSDLTGTPVLAAVATSGAYSDLSGTPTLAAVATTGAYNDLSGKPDLSVYAPLAGASFTGTVTVSAATALKLTNASASLYLDSASAGDGLGTKRITCNDGGGNFTIRGGSYYSAGDLYGDANNGALKIQMNFETATGLISLMTAPTTTTAGSAISWDTIVNISGGAMDVATGTLKQGGKAVWHAGNLTPSNYALLSGADFTGALTVSGNQVYDNSRITITTTVPTSATGFENGHIWLIT